MYAEPSAEIQADKSVAYECSACTMGDGVSANDDDDDNGT